MTKYNIENIIDDYNKGNDRKKLMEKYGISNSYLSKILRGVDRKSQPPAKNESQHNESIEKPGEVMTNSIQSGDDEPKIADKKPEYSESKHADEKPDDESEDKAIELNYIYVKPNQIEESNTSINEKHNQIEKSNTSINDSIDEIINEKIVPENITDTKPTAIEKKNIPDIKPIDLEQKDNQIQDLKKQLEDAAKTHERKMNHLKEQYGEMLDRAGPYKEVKPIIPEDPDVIRHKILVIRNYINHFEDILKPTIICEFGTKVKMFKKLYELNSSQLDNILQQIRVELVSSKSVAMFHNIADMAILGIEKSSGLFRMDLTGLSTNCKNDAQFQSAITQLGCEYSIDLPPKKQILLSLAYNISSTYSMNVKKKQDTAPKTLNDVLAKHQIDLQKPT